MASAKSDVVKSVTVTLTMNEDEAYYLHSLLRSVSGRGKLRDFNTEICNALRTAGTGYSPATTFKGGNFNDPELKENY